jgi:hypothetical protein
VIGVQQEEVRVTREVWVPVKVRIWAQGKHYLAVIREKQDVELLSRYVNKPVVLKINGIYIDGALYQTRHGKSFEIHMQLPKRLAPTWEALRRKGIGHDAIVIIRLEDGNEEVVEP